MTNVHISMHVFLSWNQSMFNHHTLMHIKLIETEMKSCLASILSGATFLYVDLVH